MGSSMGLWDPSKVRGSFLADAFACPEVTLFCGLAQGMIRTHLAEILLASCEGLGWGQ